MKRKLINTSNLCYLVAGAGAVGGKISELDFEAPIFDRLN
jgi:hypothetical protein